MDNPQPQEQIKIRALSAQTPEAQAKRKATNQERYGGDSPAASSKMQTAKNTPKLAIYAPP